ncbi:MAG: homoserine O-succinyltransferase [Chitinivibrionales bacterium]|nr:homoserine O-succinyltransferase [Chitinivibrionales bacterium]
MTVVLPDRYHGWNALENARIHCISFETAIHEDIRALRIGILNIMPKAETYEFMLIHPLGRSVLQIEPVFIRLKNHTYTSSNQEHLASLYVTFEEAVRRSYLDGLILTGAPVEEMPFENVTYWSEIQRILRYAHDNIPSTLGICWGGLAIANWLGIDKVVYPQKLFGVYRTRNLDRGHGITGDMDDEFDCPQSRFSGVDDTEAERARDEGRLKLLAYAERGGYTIFESTDSRFLVHLGHPEYEPRRLIEEYERDRAKGVDGVAAPENLDLDKATNTWRGHRTEFFSQWIKYIHETRTY